MLRDLDVIQRWFASVITHPEGVEAGVSSEAAQRYIHMNRDELERVVTRSENLTAEQRLGIYANAYFARLLEVMRDSFPVLTLAMGQDAFDAFAMDYLQRYPSRSYTLDRLTERFAEYLEATRPDDGAAWATFLIDLARLEQTIAEVFDGPGVEGHATLTAENLAAVAPDQWEAARIEPAPCLRLMRFEYPVNAYWTAARHTPEDQPVDLPEPGVEHVAISRRDYIVRRYTLTAAQYALLEAVVDGCSLADAIQRAASVSDEPDAVFGEQLRGWFAYWTAEQLFVGVRV